MTIRMLCYKNAHIKILVSFITIVLLHDVRIQNSHTSKVCIRNQNMKDECWHLIKWYHPILGLWSMCTLHALNDWFITALKVNLITC